MEFDLRRKERSYGGEGEFHTLKGYRQISGGEITESMEDYLEMLSRYMMEKGYMRIGELAEQLHRPTFLGVQDGVRLRSWDWCSSKNTA